MIYKRYSHNFLKSSTSIFLYTYIFLSLLLFFPNLGISYEIAATAKTAYPFYNFLSANTLRNTIYVTAKLYPFVEITIDRQTFERKILAPQDEKVLFSSFSLGINEPAVITFSGVENLIPAIELNNEKGIIVPEEAVNSQIVVGYALFPVSSEYLPPEKLNNRTFNISPEEQKKDFELSQRLKIKRWDSIKKEGTYPFIWHEDPEGFVITITMSPLSLE